MDEDKNLDLNFWPSFSDLMLLLVFVMVIMMTSFIVYLAPNNMDLRTIQQNQMHFVNAIALGNNTEYIQDADNANLYHISTSSNSQNDIQIRNDAKVQLITFSTNILFEPDSYLLNEKGRDVLFQFGGVLKDNISMIKEIQIQGHADIEKTKRHGSNLRLAAFRAITVYDFLQQELGIDPSVHLMSVTSFGEYKPVQRSEESEFNSDQLKESNNTAEKKDANRRIEILLFYR